jgi:2-oxoglutarate ferredoxin oxidoreductase subunit delta
MPAHQRSRGPRGQVHVHDDECKGCALCVQVCPVHGLQINRERLNRLGYHPVQFVDCECTGCGVCFYACPEPGALHVVRPQKPSGSKGASVPVADAAHEEAPQ